MGNSNDILYLNVSLSQHLTPRCLCFLNWWKNLDPLSIARSRPKIVCNEWAENMKKRNKNTIKVLLILFPSLTARTVVCECWINSNQKRYFLFHKFGSHLLKNLTYPSTSDGVKKPQKGMQEDQLKVKEVGWTRNSFLKMLESVKDKIKTSYKAKRNLSKVNLCLILSTAHSTESQK